MKGIKFEDVLSDKRILDIGSGRGGGRKKILVSDVSIYSCLFVKILRTRRISWSWLHWSSNKIRRVKIQWNWQPVIYSSKLINYFLICTLGRCRMHGWHLGILRTYIWLNLMHWKYALLHKCGSCAQRSLKSHGGYTRIISYRWYFW